MGRRSSKRTRKKKKNPCFGSENAINSKACIRAQIRDNPWMLEEGGIKSVGKGPLYDEIMRIKRKKSKNQKNKKKTKKAKKAGGPGADAAYAYFKKKKNKITKKPKKPISKFNCTKCKKLLPVNSYQPAGGICEKCQPKNKTQMGGALCLPCMSPILSGLSVIGAGVGAAIAGKKYSSKKVSKSTIKNGSIQREEKFESIKENGKTKKMKYLVSQKDKKVTFKKGKNKKVKNFKTIQAANKYYNKLITDCEKKCK